MYETTILVGILTFIFGFAVGMSFTSGLYAKKLDKIANKKNDDRCTEINIIEL